MNRRAFLATALAPAFAAPATKPNVRAITGFVYLDRTRYQSQVESALKSLQSARTAVTQAGYEVQSVRIVTQPFGEYTKGLSKTDALNFFRDYDELAGKAPFDANIGPADASNARLLAEILSTTRYLNASLHTASENGIDWKAIQAAAALVKYVQEHSPGSAGNFNFATTSMLAPYTPFYPGAWHNANTFRFAVGLESANIVDQIFSTTKDEKALAAALTHHAVQVEKAVQSLEGYIGIDPTPAPLKNVSIGAAVEKFTGARFGARGTMTACAAITRAVQSVQVKRTGYSGLMLPVMEDARIAQRWSEGACSIDALLAYSAVCATGLDTIPLAGDTPVELIEKILGDVASLAYKWKKPLACRLMPVQGKRVGEMTSFNDPFLVNAKIQPV